MARTEVKLLLGSLPVVCLATWGALASNAVFGCIVAIALAFFLFNRPRAALGFWLVVLAIMPFWLAVDVGAKLPPTALASFVVLPAALRGYGASGEDWKPRGGDMVLVLGVFCTALLVVVEKAPNYTIGTLVAQGVTAYFVGRRLSLAAGEQWTYRAIGITTVALAAWSVTEYFTGWHLFTGVHGAASLDFWSDIEYRAGQARSEAAWGHPLALGSMLSMGIPFVFMLRWRFPLLLLVNAGILATLSRGPILGAVVALGLCVVFLPTMSIRQRVAALLAAIAGAAIGLPFLLARFSDASGELKASSDYRAMLLRLVPGDMHWFGRADYVTTNTHGTLSYRGTIGSIDNAFLLIGLDLGWVVLGIFSLGLLAAFWRTISLRARTAEVALASQIVLLLTVAMITQYQAAVYFVAGVAVAWARSGRDEAAEEPEEARYEALGGKAYAHASG